MKRYGFAGALACLPAIAMAQPHPTYIAVQAGGSWLQSADNASNGIDIQSDYKTGYQLALRVGRRVAPHWRVEWELGYTSNDVNKLTIKNDGGLGQRYFGQSLNGLSVDASGRMTSISGLVNALYDFTPDQPFHPYIGAGIGAADIRADNIAVQGITVADDSTMAFAYQGIAGIELDVTPQTAVYVSYHYFSALNPQLQDTLGYKFDTEYKSSNAEIGLRYFFR